MARKSTTTTTPETTTTETEQTMTETTTTETAATLAETLADVATQTAPETTPVDIYVSAYGTPLGTDEEIASAISAYSNSADRIHAQGGLLALSLIARAASKGRKMSQRDAAKMTGVSQTTISRAGQMLPILRALSSSSWDSYDATLTWQTVRHSVEIRDAYLRDSEGIMLTGDALRDAMVTLSWDAETGSGSFYVAETETPETPAETPETPETRAPGGIVDQTDSTPVTPGETGEAGGSLQTGDPATVTVSLADRIAGLRGTVTGLVRLPADALSADERAEIAAIAATLTEWIA